MNLIEQIKVNDTSIDGYQGTYYSENSEYVKVTTDTDGKVLCGIRDDGTVYIPILDNPSIDTKLNNAIEEFNEKAQQIEDDIDAKMALYDEILGCFSVIEDPEERSEITTDSENKVISYRDADGVKHENVGITANSATFNSINLSNEGLTDLEKALKEHGFTGGQGDWSDAKELHINEPYCAIVNFSGIENIPQLKYTDSERPKAYMQFWDMNGNYFKKEVLINAQGRSSMGMPKKNIAIDICNNNGWDDDDTFKLQIGDWVPQDSFHLKAYYTDPFRCLCPITYKIYDQFVKTNGPIKNYVWKRAKIDSESITDVSTGTTDIDIQYDFEAKCFPMGFPCIVYLNGIFYGIYSWQLKKHRDNYEIEKKTAEHIHLDGVIDGDSVLNANGDPSLINWDATDSYHGFEIRNPKSLYCMDGTKYDADFNSKEIIDETSEYYNSSNKDHVRTAKVKKYIINLSKVLTKISEANDVYDASEKTIEDVTAFKDVFETYFDKDNLIEYLIISDLTNNWDGFGPNWQWLTYDGIKWYIGIYDVDCVMGNTADPRQYIYPAMTGHTYRVWSLQYQYLMKFYKNEYEQRYKELRDLHIIDSNNIISLVLNWLNRLGGKETFEKEWAKWPDFIKEDSPLRLYKWLTTTIINLDVTYNYNQN